jgi:DNA invertase Pin-like site-specific DNA recombinase
MTSRPNDGRRNETAERVDQLLDKGMSALEVARLLGISPQAVYRTVERNKLVHPRDRQSA